MLKKISFIIAISGIAVLLGLILLSPKPAGLLDDINDMEINEKVMLQGIVDSERDFGDFRIWNIEGIEVVCDCKESYLGKEVEIVGLVEEFNEKKQVRVLEIKILS